MTFACPSLTVQLVTHSAASEGFRAHYTAYYQEFCSGTKMYTNATGNITDGSDELDYNDFANCKFRIMLNTQYSAVGFHVNSLELEEGHDYLRFYDNTVSEANFLMSLTGHISDTDFVLNSRRLTLVLETDESGRDAGFDIDYTAGHVGIDDHSCDRLAVYPTPATDHVTVVNDTPVGRVEVFNAEGRLVYDGSPDSEQFDIATSGWSAGVYFLKANANGKILTRKIVKW
jgi:hypothetical protein